MMKSLRRAGPAQKVVLSIEIAKVPLCLLVAFSALFGYIFAAEALNIHSITVFCAVFFLACGGASLNSLQDRAQDGLMVRTSKRPIVLGRVTGIWAFSQAILLMICGLLGLYLFSNGWAFFAGLTGILIYNFVYTLLKARTLYAIVPGAICGAIPPYIGWLAAGGEFLSFRAFLPMLLLFFWQIPHFFLVILQYKKDYTKNILPNLYQRLSEQALRRIFLPWVTALVTTMITFSVLPSSMGKSWRVLIVANGAALLIFFYYQMLWQVHPNYRLLFRSMNISIFLLMATVCFGSLGIAV